jgi:hypothetical protein
LITIVGGDGNTQRKEMEGMTQQEQEEGGINSMNERVEKIGII